MACANLPGKSASLGVRGAGSSDQHPFGIIARFGADVFHASLPICAKKVEPQTILLWMYQPNQLELEIRELCRVQQTLEYRILNPLTHVLTSFGYLSEASTTFTILRVNIIDVL